MLQIAIARATPKGLGEDDAVLHQDGDTLMVVIADGAGGMGGGASAAAVATEWTPRLFRTDLGAGPPASEAACDVLRLLDATIEGNLEAGEAAVVIALVSETAGGARVTGASVGDCEAWIVTADDYVDLTEAQRRDYRRFGLAGSGAAEPYPFEAELAGGTLVVASDGLFRYASPERVCATCRGDDLQEAAWRLIELVRLPSGGLQDDVTVALCRHR